MILLLIDQLNFCFESNSLLSNVVFNLGDNFQHVCIQTISFTILQ
jgi:hypothetical protein